MQELGKEVQRVVQAVAFKKKKMYIIKQAVAELFFLALSPDSTSGSPFLPLVSSVKIRQ